MQTERLGMAARQRRPAGLRRTLAIVFGLVALTARVPALEPETDAAAAPLTAPRPGIFLPVFPTEETRWPTR